MKFRISDEIHRNLKDQMDGLTSDLSLSIRFNGMNGFGQHQVDVTFVNRNGKRILDLGRTTSIMGGDEIKIEGLRFDGEIRVDKDINIDRDIS